MKTPEDILLLGLETHSPEKIEAALFAGLDVNGVIAGRAPFTWLLEMYLRSPRFSDCVRCLIKSGAQCPDGGLLAVLLDDAEMLAAELRASPWLIHHRVDIRCAFTPLVGASLLHVAAEFGLVNAAAVLLQAGADVEAKASVDEYGYNGHTPIFHTVCQHQNYGLPLLRLLLDHGARIDTRLAGITWGESFEWATVIFDATPISYAQAGLLPQFGREECDVYENIRLLARASGRAVPEDLNVPNAYLRS